MLNQALYECVQSILLQYRYLVDVLIDIEFEINPHGLYVANSTIENKQCVIIQHADNIKISYINMDAVKNVISQLEEKFSKIIVNFGLGCDFIGIKIRFLENKMLEVDIRSYLKKATDDFSKDNLRFTKNPAKLSLLDADMNSHQ